MKNPLLKISILLLICGLFLIFVNPAQHKFYYDCVVLDKLQTPPGYKVESKFILVLNYNRNIFNLNVSPSCWSQSDVGETLTFKLTRLIAESNPRWKIYDKWIEIGFMVCFFISGVLLTIYIAFELHEEMNKPITFLKP